MWEFCPKKEKVAEFEQQYSSDGMWVQFFRKGEGYIDTVLCVDREAKCRYVTIDRWVSEKAYVDFHRTNLLEYEAIDKRCEKLTEREALIGYFETIASD